MHSSNKIAKRTFCTEKTIVDHGNLQEIKNQRKFFEYVANNLKIKQHEDWYNVTRDQIQQLGGQDLLQSYGGSLSKALQASFPDIEWSSSYKGFWDDVPTEVKYKKAKFRQPVPFGYWNDIHNQRKFLADAEKKLNIKKMEDWYNVSMRDIMRLGGSGLLSHYRGSVISLVQTVYPEYQWIPWKFQKVPRRFWDSVDNKRNFLEHFAQSKQISMEDEWTYITTKDFSKAGGGYLYSKYGTLQNLFATVFPGLKKPSNARPLKRQHMMIKCLRTFFQEAPMIENYNHPDIKFNNTRKRAQLDAYFPTLMLAFEYQGEQHYGHSSFMRENLAFQAARDVEKQEGCNRLGITLIHIPYWWDGSKEQLAATIADARPDLIPSASVKVKPITRIVPPTQQVFKLPSHDYTVSLGSGRSSKCRGCGINIPNDKLRIIARVTGKRFTEGYKTQICLNKECLQLALKSETAGCKFPPLTDIKVPRHIMAQHQLPDGFTWKEVAE